MIEITGKIALIGDTHFARRVDTKLVRELIEKGQLDYFESLVPKFKESGVTTIFFTGDVHDTKNSINVKALINTKRLLQDTFKDFDIHIITGNHDMYDENTCDYDYVSLELFDNIPNVTLHLKGITKMKVNGYDWYMMPWITNNALPGFIDYISKITDHKNTVFFGHFEMMNIDMEGGNMAIHGTDPSLYTKHAKYIFSGHYHGKSLTEIDSSSINYLGSPYPLTYANSDQEHGVWILNEDMTNDFLVNDISPQFTTIWDTNDITKIETLNNKFARIYMSKSKTEEEKFKFINLIKELQPLHINKLYYEEDEVVTELSIDVVSEAQRKTSLSLPKLFLESVNKRINNYPTLETVDNVGEQIMTTIYSYADELSIEQ